MSLDVAVKTDFHAAHCLISRTGQLWGDHSETIYINRIRFSYISYILNDLHKYKPIRCFLTVHIPALMHIKNYSLFSEYISRENMVKSHYFKQIPCLVYTDMNIPTDLGTRNNQ